MPYGVLGMVGSLCVVPLELNEGKIIKCCRYESLLNIWYE